MKHDESSDSPLVTEGNAGHSPPWQTDQWFEPIPHGCFGAFDAGSWRTAASVDEFNALLAEHPGARTGPFVLPGIEKLLSLWDMPGLAEGCWAALQRNVRAAIHRSLGWTALFGMLVAFQYLKGPNGNIYLWLLALLFGIMPLASALTERWQMTRKDFVRPGALSDLRFDAWLHHEKSLATYAIMTAIIAIYTATCLASSSGRALELEPNEEVLLAWGLKVNSLIWQGQVWRLFTCIFLHANPVHIIFNSIALYQLGRVAEALLGFWRTMAFFLITGLVGSAASLLLSPHPSLGASGAVCGLLGVLVAFAWSGLAPSFLGRSVQSMVIGIMLLGFLASGYIDNAAHAGGLAAGIGLGWQYFKVRWPPVMDRSVD